MVWWYCFKKIDSIEDDLSYQIDSDFTEQYL